MLSIVQAPNEILRKKAKKVTTFDEKLKTTIDEMVETMLAQKEPEGVGLAANQVGLPLNLFVARFGTKKTDFVRIFINAEILSHSEEMQPEKTNKKSPLEGCLSKPDYYGVVKRWQKIKIKFQNENGEAKTEEFEGFPATVIQHEIDHLEGKIFIERILEQKGKLYKITKGKSKENWEEVEL